MADLGGQVAVVTGAGRGIGADLARALAADGAAVGLIGRTPGTLEAVRDEIVRSGGRALTAVADVTRAPEVDAAVGRLRATLGDVDLLVSNAGAREKAPLPPWAADPDDWWRVLETNVRGPFHLARAVVPAMVDRGSGRVLHIGSGMGLRGHPDWSAYATSKAALSRLTDSMATALAGTGVAVLEVSPGLVRTDMTEDMWGPAAEQPWNPVENIVAVTLAFARGQLDALHGRFLHASRDELARVLAAVPQIVAADARTLRLRPWGHDDPLA